MLDLEKFILDLKSFEVRFLDENYMCKHKTSCRECEFGLRFEVGYGEEMICDVLGKMAQALKDNTK